MITVEDTKSVNDLLGRSKDRPVGYSHDRSKLLTIEPVNETRRGHSGGGTRDSGTNASLIWKSERVATGSLLRLSGKLLGGHD